MGEEKNLSELEKPQRQPLLEPVHRVSEIIFGLIMALTFTCTLSAASAGREEVRTMLIAALGCNLAWGMVDAVMYLMTTLIERARNITLFNRLRTATDTSAAHAILIEAMPGNLSEFMGAEGLNILHRNLTGLREPPAPGKLVGGDFVAAFGVFLLVVLSTFPVVIPFILIQEAWLAMRVSNAIAIVMLFVAGWTLAHYAGVSRWRYGVGMTVIGVLVVAATIALGG